MSSISTNLSMNGKQLFSENELLTCSMFNFKMFLFVLTILICISCISMLMNSLFAPVYNLDQYKEKFSNNLFFSDKDTINPGYSSYQSTALTSDNHLIFGQANRYIQFDIKDIITKPNYTDIRDTITKPNYILDIYANLYVINGSPFGKSPEKPLEQKYAVYLKNTRTSEKVEIGKLNKDGDGIYKIHFVSTEPNKYVKFNEVEITYKTANKESSLLNGKFTIV
jgi:hypothetical protein